MRRVIHQTWQRLSARERILAGAAGAFLVLVAVRFGVVDPYRAYAARLEVRIAREAERVQHMRERQESSSQVASRVQQLRTSFSALEGRFVPGDTPALAAARLQERLRSLAAESGLELLTTQVMKAESVGAFRKVVVQVTLRGQLPAVASFLAGVEYGDWLLSVSSLEMRDRGKRRSRRRRARQKGQQTRPADNRLRPLTITLKVGGIMTQATAS